MLAILGADGLRAVRELEQLRIEAARQDDADMLARGLDGEQAFHFPWIGLGRKNPVIGECSPGSHRRAAWHLRCEATALTTTRAPRGPVLHQMGVSGRPRGRAAIRLGG